MSVPSMSKMAALSMGSPRAVKQKTPVRMPVFSLSPVIIGLRGFLAGNLGAGAASFRQANRDCLLAAFHLFAAASAFQFAAFEFVHLALNGLPRLRAVLAPR